MSATCPQCGSSELTADITLKATGVKLLNLIFVEGREKAAAIIVPRDFLDTEDFEANELACNDCLWSSKVREVVLSDKA